MGPKQQRLLCKDVPESTTKSLLCVLSTGRLRSPSDSCTFRASPGQLGEFFKLPRVGERWDRHCLCLRGSSAGLSQHFPSCSHSSGCKAQPGESLTPGAQQEDGDAPFSRQSQHLETGMRNPHSCSLLWLDGHLSVQPSLQRILVWLQFWVEIPSQIHAPGFHPAIPTAPHALL